jgi:hypothetical protein
LTLWTTLLERQASQDALSFVAEAYERRAGRPPEEAGSGND